jgi:hypothetical protein
MSGFFPFLEVIGTNDLAISHDGLEEVLGEDINCAFTASSGGLTV